MMHKLQNRGEISLGCIFTFLFIVSFTCLGGAIGDLLYKKGALGLVIGFTISLLLCILFSSVSGWFEDRKHFPVCRTGKCVTRKHFKIVNSVNVFGDENPDSKRVVDIHTTYICRCGLKYQVFLRGNRCFEVLSDGQIRPYLKRDKRGNWIPDTDQSLPLSLGLFQE